MDNITTDEPRPLRRRAVESQSKTTPSMKKVIRVLLVDDHPVVRKGLCSCLAKQDNLKIVGEAGDGRQALAKARELRPDLMLMDIDLPEMDGLAVAAVLQQELPQIQVIFLSMHSEGEYVMRILQSGAKGYVLKHAPTEELVLAIEKVHSGETYFSPEVAKVALNQIIHNQSAQKDGKLTTREKEVLVHIAEGLSNKEIACKLGVGVRTVETHRERIMRKLDIHSVAGLTRFAISQGLIKVPKPANP
jgi:two-component system, NarL family, nitrate/nitrite response regulator NarL